MQAAGEIVIAGQDNGCHDMFDQEASMNAYPLLMQGVNGEP
jgi:hypothetical protein